MSLSQTKPIPSRVDMSFLAARELVVGKTHNGSYVSSTKDINEGMNISLPPIESSSVSSP